MGVLFGLALLSLSAAEDAVRGAIQLSVPTPGDQRLRVLAPDLLELELTQLKAAGAAALPLWNFGGAGDAITLAVTRFTVEAGGAQLPVQAVGFKQRVAYAPLSQRDLRVGSCLYLQLAGSLPEGESVRVGNPDGLLWAAGTTLTALPDPLRLSPAIHVNQEGYLPVGPKRAMVGYYLGSLGEMVVPAGAGFRLIRAESGEEVYRGELRRRADRGYTYAPAPYQSVYEADFSAVTAPGLYRLAVPGLGASLPFRIDEGIAMNFARTYALGLYHQRCGPGGNGLPFTRFAHGDCHLAPAVVPLPQASFAATWAVLAQESADAAANPRHTAPLLRDEAAQRYPFVNPGPVDTSGGHHDAGDYSKYTTNSAALVHALMFAVDALPGVAELDNLGLPESGDGVPDLLQEAKWEADFLAKLQDADGGFYFLVYPRGRRYESDVLPDRGDPQLVWPKNTAATAAAVAALAQTASSPRFRQRYPEVAARLLAQAQRGWRFLEEAIARHGRDGAYQKLTHYGDVFLHDDELAWAATELFLATGEATYHARLREWFNPADPATRRWGWWRLSEGYGNAIRSYAFAAASGRLAADRLDATHLARCRAEIEAAGRDALRWSDQCAYGSSFPEETKRVRGGGWYFSLDQAFDLVVAQQLDYPPENDPRPHFREAYLANLNYEAGTNPVNVVYVTGLGWRRQRELVHQYAQNDRRVLPPSGLPIGNIQTGQPVLPPYTNELARLSFPEDGANVAPYPYYDRWSDTFNVSTEFIVVNQARALAGLAFLAAQTPLRSQPWRPVAATVDGIPPGRVAVNAPVQLALQPPAGMDVGAAKIVWEIDGGEPVDGPAVTFTPRRQGAHWIEAEASWPDGRRVFAAQELEASDGRPEISVVAQQGEASVPAGTRGVFSFHRTGDVAAALTVDFRFSGTATKWNDFRRPEGDMPENVVFPAGAAEVTLTIVPVAASLAGTRKVTTLSLLPNPAYVVTEASQASIQLVGTTVTPPNPGPGSDPVPELRPPTRPRPPALVVATPGLPLQLDGSAEGEQLSYEWRRDGRPLAGAAARLSWTTFQPGDAGLYTVTARNAAGAATSPAILVAPELPAGVRWAGTVAEGGRGIVHANGQSYDQFLLTGPAATVRSESGRTTRVSYVDLDGDIVQIEIAGPGSLTLVLEAADGPAPPEKYRQAGVNYVRGHARLYFTGTAAESHLQVFSVGPLTAVDQALFQPGTDYDGVAQIAAVVVTSPTNAFGGIYGGDAAFFADTGVTGIYAPDIAFNGPLILHDLNAVGEAAPVLLTGGGSRGEVYVAGGSLIQDNRRAIQVAGVSRLVLCDGTDSHRRLLPAQANQARFVRDGVDVTDAIVVAPGAPGP